MDLLSKTFNIEDFTYPLPDDRIAKYPLKERDKSKLLIYRNGTINEDIFENIANYLPLKSVLVFNNTKVIPARLLFSKETGAVIEIFCLEPLSPSEYTLSLSSKNKVTWKCLIGNLKRLKSDKISKKILYKTEEVILTASILKKTGDSHEIEFSWNNSALSFSEILELTGKMPIPPYLKRDSEESDKDTYQTVYSKIKGSVAAPTAGLHFTDKVIKNLQKSNIDNFELTLHVGAGTFVPVKSSNILSHNMHDEYFSVDIEVLKYFINKESFIIPVGTTSLRTLESIYWLGIKCISGQNIQNLEQWEWLNLNQNYSLNESLSALIQHLEKNNKTKLEAKTRIMIIPGYNFRVTKGLITNFHQPKSTLLMLIAAFIGDNWRKVYKYALDNNFRFLSYGDSSLLFK
jgi:S-adenosylmethionine:tRNA ribosyltransferase-isomerase